MKSRMFAVFTHHSKWPRAIFISKWKAENYIKTVMPDHVKCRIERMMVVLKKGTMFEIIKHEYKHL